MERIPTAGSTPAGAAEQSPRSNIRASLQRTVAARLNTSSKPGNVRSPAWSRTMLTGRNAVKASGRVARSAEPKVPPAEYEAEYYAQAAVA